MPPSRTPPTADTTAAMDQASAKIRFTEMPMESDLLRERRRAHGDPLRVYLKKSEKRTSRTNTLATL